MDSQLLIISIASITIGIHVGRVWTQMGQKKLEEHIRLNIAQQYHDRWEAMFGTPAPTKRDGQGQTQVIDLRMRKK